MNMVIKYHTAHTYCTSLVPTLDYFVGWLLVGAHVPWYHKRHPRKVV